MIRVIRVIRVVKVVGIKVMVKVRFLSDDIEHSTRAHVLLLGAVWSLG